MCKGGWCIGLTFPLSCAVCLEIPQASTSRSPKGLSRPVMGSGKSVPLQAWSGPEGSRKLRFPDFMTTAQGGGKVVSHKHRLHLLPGNSPGTHFC